MIAEVIYMLGIIAAGFLVNYALRALPFLLFAGRDRELPPWVKRFGAFVSPVIIGCLIVYSYATLKTLAGLPASSTHMPYVAGILTVVLQIVGRNALVSIVVGTALYMVLVNCGCVTESTLEFDRNHPCISVANGEVRFAGRAVKPTEVPALLEKHQIPKDATIHILLEDDKADNRALWVFRHNVLGHAGYRHSIFVSKRRADSETRKSGGKGARP